MSGIWPKLRRAAELINEIDQAVQNFLDALPPLYVEGSYKAGSSIYVFRAFGSCVAPSRLAVLAGEVLYLQRSALDHVITKLIHQSGGKESRRSQFPICRTLEQYNECLRRGYLDGVSEFDKQTILRMQPFHSSNAETSTLLALTELNNADKHRLLLMAVAAAHVGKEIRVGGPGNKVITGMSPPYSHALSENGGEFFSIDFEAVYRDLEVSIDVARTIAIARPDNLRWPFKYTPVMSLLREIQQCIENSIKQS